MNSSTPTQNQDIINTSPAMRGPFHLNAGHLKMAAVITMLIDHVAASFLLYCLMPQASAQVYDSLLGIYWVMRTVGRTAFPIFCFFIVEGAQHTRNAKKYALRLLLFGLASEIPFDLAFSGQLADWENQNVYWTLLIGLIVVRLLEKCRLERPRIYALRLVVMLAGMLAAYLLKTDYGAWGILLILAMYVLRRYRLAQIGVGALLILKEMQNVWIWIPLALLVLLLWGYDGTRGKSMKYFFYAFYPAHLLILGLVRVLVYGG